MSTPVFPSRLPQVGTTIFSTMSALAPIFSARFSRHAHTEGLT